MITLAGPGGVHWTGPWHAGRFVVDGLVTHVHDEQETRTTASDEAALIGRLRDGDERAFEALVEQHYSTMLAVARTYVRTRAVAEEVVQEAWLGVLKGLERFEGRSSLKTWIMRIVANTAMTRGAREARSVPFTTLAPQDEEAAVEPERFRGPEDGFPGHWRGYPADWQSLPDEALLGQETRQVIMQAIEELPEAQRAVITLRDVTGCSAEEVCSVLDVSEGNQRVLLHRARSRVRSALERHLNV
jgi:RNA polymerase sigma-70 factor, ECF subfamily